MGKGLPGRMHEFYRLVSNATWGGGHEEYSALNEAWPYYINGLVPLAFALDDQQLLGAINQQISYVLLKQFPNGWLGPEAEVATRNFWGRYPFFLAAAQYVEAADVLDARNMLRAMHRFVDIMHDMLKHDYQGYVWKEGDRFDQQWGRSRAADMVMALQWLYEHYPENNHVKIHECMFMIYQKAYDWSWWFEESNFLKHDLESYPPELIDPLFPFLHVVNAAQGLKSPAVMGRLVHVQSLFDSSRRGVNLTLKHKGTPSGAIYGDERLSGNSPKRGTELCSVVEEMFSLSTLYQILGDASFADRLELAAFNALPAMIMPNWWAHQYVAQTNQPYSYELRNQPFWNVGPWGVTFGTEPNYPCCAVNFPQGYPKLLSNAWVRTPEHKGLAHAVLIPSEVTVILRAILDQDNEVENKVHVQCDTNYPFTQDFSYHIDADHAFNFSFRVPEWVDLDNDETRLKFHEDIDARISGWTTQKPHNPVALHVFERTLHPDTHTGLHTLPIPQGRTSFDVTFAPKQSSSKSKSKSHLQRPIVHSRPNSAISLTHGSLLFAHTLHGIYTPRRPANYQSPGEAPHEANDWTIVPRTEGYYPDLSSSSQHHCNEYNPSYGHKQNMVPWNIAIDPTTAVVHTSSNAHSNPDCLHDTLATLSNLNSAHENQEILDQACSDDFPNPIWAEFAPPVSISVLACEVAWNMSGPVEYENGKAVRGGYPLEPPTPTRDPKTGRTGHKCTSRAFMIELKPYGSAKIRVAEFPIVDLGSGSKDLMGDDEWEEEL